MTTLGTLTVAISALLAVGILLDKDHLSGKTTQRIRETLIWFFLGLVRVRSRSLQLWPWQLLRTMVWVGLISALVAVAGFFLSTRAHHRLTETFGNAIIGQALVVIIFFHTCWPALRQLLTFGARC